ncbi:MAG: ABC transporter permease subunit, partial [Chloroflexota bacterium]
MAQIAQKSTSLPMALNGNRYRNSAIFVAGLVILFVLASAVPWLDTFPESWNVGLRETLNEFKRWVVVNRTTHWIFLFFFEPLSAVIDFGLRRVEDFLLWLPWPVVILAIFLFAERISGLRLAFLTAICLIPMGTLGLWRESMQTLALMVTAVLFTLAVGVPLGIWAARNSRVERVLRPILDAMQTMPAFVYLIPVLLFFGVARVPSIIATVIYALPPIIRLTTLGIHNVSPDVIEAAHSFGSTDRQLLRKLQLPLAMPTILVGVNQTIMMALSIVVIAALIGAGGLGDVVLKALRRLRVGSALEAGLAIVLMAVLLDRLSVAVANIERHSAPQFQGFRLFSEKQRGNTLVEAIERGLEQIYRGCNALADWVGQHVERWPSRYGRWLSAQRQVVTIVILLVILSFALQAVGVVRFPPALRIDISGPVDALVKWMQVNLYDIGGSGIGTGPLRDFLIIRIFQPLQLFLAEILPWTVVAFIFIWAAFTAGGWRLMLTVSILTILFGLLGMWPFTMDTLAQTIVAVVICVGMGIPLGIWSAHDDRAEKIIRPILDFLQTIPIFVYLVPVIMLFGSGSVAGLIASVLYAAVPVVRLTNAGIRSIDTTVLESATAFGTTPRQTLFKIEVPLALPSIMLGINQTIMMVLAMVIIAGLVGATGLGLEVYQGFANDNLGRSVEAGFAIVHRFPGEAGLHHKISAERADRLALETGDAHGGETIRVMDK